MAVGMFLLFLGLKLTGHIDWSWLWVSMPLIVLAGLTVFIIGIALIFVAGFAIYKALGPKRKHRMSDAMRGRFEEMHIPPPKKPGIWRRR